MQLLAILGSPRKTGNLSAMLDAVVAGARRAGHQVEYIDLYSLGLLPCTGCMACRKTGRCVLGDDLALLRDTLLACDAVVLAAPTYFANVPGPVKTLFDRLSGAVMAESPSGIPHGKLSKRQQYYLLTACTTPAPFDRLCGQSAGALRAMREFFRTAGMTATGSTVFAGSKGRCVPQSLLARLERVFTP